MEETFGTIIVVGDNGHVWVAQSAVCNDKWLHMTNARIIREWGTTKGLNQLVTGPTGTTTLDQAAPMVSLTMRALLAIIPCVESGWSKQF